MKIIRQYHEIISLPEKLLETIELAGRTCYKSEDKITEGSAEKFVSKLVTSGHHAMIEFGDIIVRFVTNRGVTHELVRHRLCNFAQESTRYVKYDGEMEFIEPVWYGRSSYEELCIFRTSLIQAEENYQELLMRGWSAQQAREVLPNALKTEIVVKANIREWRHIFNLRCSNKAHPQIRDLMRDLLKELKTKVPVVFDDLIFN